VLSSNPAGILHPDCQAAVLGAAQLIESLGHEVVEDFPVIDPGSGRRFMARWTVNARLNLLGLGQTLGRPVTEDDVEPLTWAMASASDGLTAVDYAQSIQAGAHFTRRMAAFWEDHDLLVTPTLGEPPPLVGELEPPPGDPFATQRRVASLVPFTTHFNVTGQPAISLPLHVGPSGLPIGVQLVAAYGREDLLIQIGSQLEEAAPWSARRPSI